MAGDPAVRRRPRRRGDAHRGRRVHPAPAGRGGAAQPGRRRGRCDEEHPVQVVRVGGGDPPGRLVGDQVGGDRARSPSRGEIGGEPLHAVALDRVPVAHHDGDGPGQPGCLVQQQPVLRRCSFGHQPDLRRSPGRSELGQL